MWLAFLADIRGRVLDRAARPPDDRVVDHTIEAPQPAAAEVDLGERRRMVAASASISFPTSTTSPHRVSGSATTAHGCIVPAASGERADKPDQPDHDQVDSNDVVQEVRHDQNQNPRDEGDDWLQNYDFHGVLPGFWCAR
jgi:hypothetical protein